MNLRRALAVAHKEWREVLRDRLFFTLAFVLPAVFMLLFGYGLSLDVENVPFAIVDHDRSAASRDYAYRFIGSRYFDFQGYASDERALDPLLKDNRIRVAIVIPARFEQNLLAGRAAKVQTLIDGTLPARAATTKGYVGAINAAASREQLAEYLARQRGLSPEAARDRVEPVRLEVRYLYNQSLSSLHSLAPKLIMLILMFVPPLLTAVGVVREKESGSIYNIYASTVSRGEFLTGKLVPYVGISVVNVLVLSLIATQVFGARSRVVCRSSLPPRCCLLPAPRPSACWCRCWYARSWRLPSSRSSLPWYRHWITRDFSCRSPRCLLRGRSKRTCFQPCITPILS